MKGKILIIQGGITRLEEIVFVCFNEPAFRIYEDIFSEITG